ncbi:MAG: glycosyltransferase [Actinobacteria bacterium]|nr:glycosyltransferase [Actinomycetota bacterium]
MQGTTVMLAAMSLDLGGAETHVVSLSRELKRRGAKVMVASSGGRLVGELEKSGIPHHRVPLNSRAPWRIWAGAAAVRRIIREEGVDLVHAHARIPAFVGELVRAGTPMVTTYHGVYDASFPLRFFSRWGDRVIAVSEDVKAHLVRNLGVPDRLIRVIPNGIDTDLFSPEADYDEVLKHFGVDDEGPRVVHLGRLSGPFAEAPLALVRATPQLADKFPGLTVWIVGDGDRFEEVSGAAESANGLIGRRVLIVPGMRVDAPAFFALATVAVGVARVAVEAMACACPVIIAGEGGYRGILSPDRFRELSLANFTARGSGESVDPSALVRDADTLLRDEALRRRLGGAGREYVLKYMSIERMTDEIVEVYRQILKRGA